MDGKFKLGLVLPVANDVSSLFRGAMPFGLLSRQLPWLELLVRESWSWADLCQCHAVFFQRPCIKLHYDIAALAKKVRVPVWVDYDDAIDIVPPSNPKWNERLAGEWTRTMHGVLGLADVITVTNDHFAARCREHTNGSVSVIPNAHNDYLTPFYDVPRQKNVVWRGGSSHDEDLMMVLPQLAEVARDHPDWQFHFIGQPCWEARRIMPRENSHFNTEWLDYFDYMAALAALGPSIQVVPWSENEFNRCKSNLAWLEASAAGAAVLAPAWADQFKVPGVTHYDGDFGGKLDAIMENPTSVELSRQHIRENLLLSGVNRMRVDILEKLLGG